MVRLLSVLFLLLSFSPLLPAEPSNARKPFNDDDLRFWLQNMVWHHRFRPDEVAQATGLSRTEVEAALRRFDIRAENRPRRAPGSPLHVLPYPGGRHPRIGFLEGAVRPQRETKVSVFTPWDDASYVVVDVPEAIWSQHGLLYLAHTHVDTVWTKKGVTLEPLEWRRHEDGSLEIERRLPNGVVFGARVLPETRGVRMDLWLTNGLQEKLSDLRVQNCVMLKGAVGFDAQIRTNKVAQAPYSAARSADGRRWIITAWEPNHRTWDNPPCPCIHSDPKFPDCPPGETRRLHGWLSFYEGDDVQAEFRRLDTVGWRQGTGQVRGRIVDQETGKPIAARLYVQGEDGAWHHARSADPNGKAVPYRKAFVAGNPRPEEVHTSLSAHPFILTLPPGLYTLTAERGKEYAPLMMRVQVREEPAEVTIRLPRWIDMAAQGWYSGETHVHRGLDELPTAMLAEDLNVTLPLLYWVTEAFSPPRRGDRNSATADPGAKLLTVDETHVIWPRNTEYEIFTVSKKAHTLGAIFVLNHKSILDEGVPPVAPVARRARQEGALLELDKHNWPWSMMLVPVMGVDLYELSNNHVWRTHFGFPTFGEPAAEFMKVERDARGFTEAGWIDYGFKNYYTLLNCGFRLRPTAGTATGVHPVPLGFGRVYVHIEGGFSYEKWLQGLDAGRSFVTTGPMLLAEVDGQKPGHTFRREANAESEVRVQGTVRSAGTISALEVVVNGEVVQRVQPTNRRMGMVGLENPFDVRVKLSGSSWIAVRCLENWADGRTRFAHTAPWHVDIAAQPLRPRRAEVEFLIKRIEDQLKRSGDVLPEGALKEYRDGLKVYQERLRTARP